MIKNFGKYLNYMNKKVILSALLMKLKYFVNSVLLIIEYISS